ncbi:MAG: PQQ-binding-like beta-propeller repeat protein [Chloroflexi bacterium]|nr:PQQ-binding-like beta-propeller repeat protein [Chloroflexota bacterium]
MITAALSICLLLLLACSGLSTPDGWSGGTLVGGVLYIGTEEGQLVALDKRTGEKLWLFDLLGEERDRAIYGSPALSGDTLYVSGYDGLLYVFDVGKSNDPLAWNDPVLRDSQEVKDLLETEPKHIVSGPVVADEDCSDMSERNVPCQIVMVGSDDGNVYTFEVTFDDEFDASIRELRRFPTGDKVWSTPAVANGVAYFGSLDHKVYAVRVDDGTLQWEFETDGGVVASPLVIDGRVYVGSFDRTFYAIDAVSGDEVWRFTGANNWYWGAAVAGGDAILAPSLDGILYALEPSTGSLRWIVPTAERIVGAPALVSEMVAVASDDGRVLVASLEDGDVKGFCTIEKKIRTPLTSEDGVVYLGARDNTIRALSVSRSGDLDEKWAYMAKDANRVGGSAC